MTTEGRELGKSKTQELSDWLGTEIKRVEDDVAELGCQLNPNMSIGRSVGGRYHNLLSDEREVKMKEDLYKLECFQKRLKLLWSAQGFEFGDTIEELERVFRGKVCLSFSGGGYNFLPPIITFSSFVSKNLEVVFEISLSNRILVVKHKVLHDNSGVYFSSIRYPNLSRIGIGKWPENVMFSFESGAEHSYLTFHPGLNGNCFLSS